MCSSSTTSRTSPSSSPRRCATRGSTVESGRHRPPTPSSDHRLPAPLVVLDVMLPDLDGFEVVPPAPPGGRPSSSSSPPATPPRTRSGAHARRRRLRHQAVQPRGARGPRPGRAPPRTRAPPREATPLVFGDLESTTTPTRSAAAAARSSYRHGVQLLRYLLLNARRVISRPDPRPRLGVRLRRRRQRRGDLRELPAQEGRRVEPAAIQTVPRRRVQSCDSPRD